MTACADGGTRVSVSLVKVAAGVSGGSLVIRMASSRVEPARKPVLVQIFSPGGTMALRLDDKKALVAEVAEVAQTAHSVVAAEYRGLPVAKLTELRAKARASRVYMRVVKNTLARRAIAGTQFECVGDQLKGPLILAFSQDDPGAAARLIKAFAKDNDKLV